LQAAVGEQSFGGDVDEVEFTALHLAFDGGGFGGAECGVQIRGAHAEFAECGDLVVHEGDERGDHDADARPHEGGDLVAERLAAARGHQHQRVAAVGYVLNDLGLLAAEGRVAEDGGEELKELRLDPRRIRDFAAIEVHTFSRTLWTLVDGPSGPLLASGFHCVNRLAYYSSERPVREGIVVDEAPDPALVSCADCGSSWDSDLYDFCPYCEDDDAIL